MSAPGTDTLAQLGLFIIKDFFDADFCSVLRAEARAVTNAPATVVKKGFSVVEERTRKTKIAEVSAATVLSIEARLNALVPELESHFDVKLTGCQTPQLLVYKKGDYFKAHQDNQSAHVPEYIRNRKVSAVVFLNSADRKPGADRYGGGSLIFYRLTDNPTADNCRTPLTGEEGLLVAFRSSTFHEVSPVIHGERYTVVSWFD